jgi:hypothetical protein
LSKFGSFSVLLKDKVLVLSVFAAVVFCYVDFSQRFQTEKRAIELVANSQFEQLSVSNPTLSIEQLKTYWPLQQNDSQIDGTGQANSQSSVDIDGTIFNLMAVYASTTNPNMWFARVSLTDVEGNTEHKLLSVNDKIGSFVVKDIAIHSVAFANDAQQFTLYLFKPTSREEAPQ